MAEPVEPDGGEAWVLQADLDDATGELLGAHLQARLREIGALDVTLAPLLMKKGRPGHRLEAVCRAEARAALTSAILEETTTIGVRAHRVQRRELPRRQETVRTPYGEVGVKAVTLPSGRVRRTPEYEDCRARAEEAGATVQDVLRAALSRCGEDG